MEIQGGRKDVYPVPGTRVTPYNFITSTPRVVATPEQVEFWLVEGRTPALLREVARAHYDVALRLQALRPLLKQEILLDDAALDRALASEQEREADDAYWKPSREELERLRHAARS